MQHAISATPQNLSRVNFTENLNRSWRCGGVSELKRDNSFNCVNAASSETVSEYEL